MYGLIVDNCVLSFWSINQSINQWCWCVCWSFVWFIGGLVQYSLVCFIDWLIDRIFVSSFDWLIVRSIGWLIEYSPVWLIDWLIDWLVCSHKTSLFSISPETRSASILSFSQILERPRGTHFRAAKVEYGIRRCGKGGSRDCSGNVRGTSKSYRRTTIKVCSVLWLRLNIFAFYACVMHYNLRFQLQLCIGRIFDFVCLCGQLMGLIWSVWKWKSSQTHTGRCPIRFSCAAKYPKM